MPGVRILLQPDADRSWFVYVIGLGPGIDRDRVARELQAFVCWLKSGFGALVPSTNKKKAAGLQPLSTR